MKTPEDIELTFALHGWTATIPQRPQDKVVPPSLSKTVYVLFVTGVLLLGGAIVIPIHPLLFMGWVLFVLGLARVWRDDYLEERSISLPRRAVTIRCGPEFIEVDGEQLQLRQVTVAYRSRALVIGAPEFSEVIHADIRADSFEWLIQQIRTAKAALPAPAEVPEAIRELRTRES